MTETMLVPMSSISFPFCSSKAHPPVISKHRSEFIDLRLKQFIHQNQIQEWPLDCVAILRKMKQSGSYGIQRIKLLKTLPEKVDAAAQYNAEAGEYAVFINHQRFCYPFQKSSHRRLNFTVAHEIGHIVLEHLILPRKSKTDREVHMEDLEADEFAARLLMPQKLLSSFNYYSIPVIAAWLNVSNSALVYRLNRLNRVDLITTRKVKSCIRCGNIRFSPFALYCGVCGQPLDRGSMGIRRIYYPDEVSMDSRKRSLICAKCQKSIAAITGEHCPCCSTSIFNLCSNIDDGCSYANPAYARCCEMCGKPTHYQREGLFPSWKREFFRVHEGV
jgi:hypothetical protein